MADYDERSFGDEASAGFWLVYYSYGGDRIAPDGPFDTVAEMAEVTGLTEYPRDGYVVYREADGSMSSVPSLNPDDLMDPEGYTLEAERAYRSHFAVPDFEDVDKALVVEWGRGDASS